MLFYQQNNACLARKYSLLPSSSKRGFSYSLVSFLADVITQRCFEEDVHCRYKKYIFTFNNYSLGVATTSNEHRSAPRPRALFRRSSRRGNGRAQMRATRARLPAAGNRRAAPEPKPPARRAPRLRLTLPSYAAMLRRQKQFTCNFIQFQNSHSNQIKESFRCSSSQLGWFYPSSMKSMRTGSE